MVKNLMKLYERLDFLLLENLHIKTTLERFLVDLKE